MPHPGYKGGMAQDEHDHPKPHHHEESEAERVAREKREREQERLRVLKEESHVVRGVEKGADLAPHQNLTPEELHRGGPLPNKQH